MEEKGELGSYLQAGMRWGGVEDAPWNHTKRDGSGTKGTWGWEGRGRQGGRNSLRYIRKKTCCLGGTRNTTAGHGTWLLVMQGMYQIRHGEQKLSWQRLPGTFGCSRTRHREQK